METPMTEWNDDRLDELNGRMKEGFADVDKRFDKVDKRFDKVDERFARIEGEMKAGFEKLNDRFDRLYYLIVMTIVGLAGSLLASNIWG